MSETESGNGASTSNGNEINIFPSIFHPTKERIEFAYPILLKCL